MLRTLPLLLLLLAIALPAPAAADVCGQTGVCHHVVVEPDPLRACASVRVGTGGGYGACAYESWDGRACVAVAFGLRGIDTCEETP